MSGLLPARPNTPAAGWRALVAQAASHQRAGDLATARGLYQQAAQSCTDPTPARLLGLLLAEQGETDDALGWLQRALLLDPHSAHSHAALGRVLAKNADWPGAAEAFRAALAHDPDLALAHQGLGHALLAAGHAHDACASFAAALRLRPQDAVVRHGYAAALAAANDPARSQAAAETFPGHGELRHVLGQQLFHARRWAEAADAFAQAAPLLPADAGVLHDWATALHEAGQPDAALTLYQQALARDPSRAQTWHNLGSVQQALGDVAAAMSAYGEAYRLDPAGLPRIAQELAAGRHGQVWLRATDLRRALASAAPQPRTRQPAARP